VSASSLGNRFFGYFYASGQRPRLTAVGSWLQPAAVSAAIVLILILAIFGLLAWLAFAGFLGTFPFALVGASLMAAALIGGCTALKYHAALKAKIAMLEADALAARGVVGNSEQARLQFLEYSDHVLRRVGAELHDGPAQLIGISLLRLDAAHGDAAVSADLTSEDGSKVENSNLSIIRQALTDALGEIRNLSQGLILPEIDKLTLAEATRLAVAKHEQRTGTAVNLSVSELPETVPAWLKRFVYRFTSEGLMNAYRHAGGVGQAVDVTDVGGWLEVKISDRGPGIIIKPAPKKPGRMSLGLAGLRERAGAIGAVIDIQSTPGAGTCMKTRIPYFQRPGSC
jgi:signal transduction histidine kinase